MNCALHGVKSKVSDICLTKEKPVQDESDDLVEALDVVAMPSPVTVDDPDIVLRYLTFYSRPPLARVLQHRFDKGKAIGPQAGE